MRSVGIRCWECGCLFIFKYESVTTEEEKKWHSVVSEEGEYVYE